MDKLEERLDLIRYLFLNFMVVGDIVFFFSFFGIWGLLGRNTIKVYFFFRVGGDIVTGWVLLIVLGWSFSVKGISNVFIRFY